MQSLSPTVPYGDLNAIGNDFTARGGPLTLTKDPAHNRSSVRGFLTGTMEGTGELTFSPSTMVAKVRPAARAQA
jgi:hypothetical protein